MGRYTLPPRTTKRRTTNLKTKDNQNCQKIELYGNPTTKELKKKHSSIVGGGAERMHGKAVDGSPHLRVDKPGGTTGEQDRPGNPGFQCRKRKPQNLWL